MKKICPLLLLFAVFAALLSACGPRATTIPVPAANPGQTGPAGALNTHAPTPIMPPALTGDVQVQNFLLTSHTRWKSMIANASVTRYPPAGVTADPDVTAVQLWIEQPGKAKVISGPPQQAPTHVFVSDGASSRWGNEPAQPLPPSINEPFNPPSGLSDTVYTHPLAGMLGTPISDLLFPAGLAQRGGEYRLTGKESFASREVYVVEWGREPGGLVERYWVDTQTGIILRHQSYGKQGSQTPETDMAITFIQIDAAIPADTFDLNNLDVQLATPEPALDPNTPQARIKPDLTLVNVRSGPGIDYEVVITLAPKMVAQITGKNAAGGWLQIAVEGVSGWVSAELLDVSGDPAAIPVVPSP